MNAIELLTTHHRKMEESLQALMDAKTVDPVLFVQAANELAAHISTEEEIFYPAVKAKKTEDILMESLEEHLSLKRVLADLLKLEVTDEKFGPKLHVLSEQAEHHHEEEENGLFPKVRKAWDDAALEALGDKMMERMDFLIAASASSAIPKQTQDSAPLH